MSSAVEDVRRRPSLAPFVLAVAFGSTAYIASFTLLAVGADVAERIRLQGLTDVVVWTASAVAGVSSGLLLDIAGYAALSLVAGALLAIPALAIAAGRSSLRTETAAERAA